LRSCVFARLPESAADSKSAFEDLLNLRIKRPECSREFDQPPVAVSHADTPAVA
jgi:hypothetical protein